ncbi:MAG TPA: hypothetical protein VKA04_12075, partial [Pseudodesulfovibrio sp.]|nr:hypothetical protein [Pseudodesulfovibrio sp.]
MQNRGRLSLAFLLFVVCVAVPPPVWSGEPGSDWFDLSPNELQQRVQQLPPGADVPGDLWDRLWQHWTPEQRRAVQKAFRDRMAKSVEESSPLTEGTEDTKDTSLAGGGKPESSGRPLQGPEVVTGNWGLGLPSTMVLPAKRIKSGPPPAKDANHDPFQQVNMPASPARSHAPNPAENSRSESRLRDYLQDELTW